MGSRQNAVIAELTRVDGMSPGSGCPKHVKMTQSPFVFLRGAAQLFYRDLNEGSLSDLGRLFTLPLTTIMGDCHVSNFGFISEEGSHSEQVIFAPNDFDDACVGRPEWDLLRFSVSVLLCVDHCQRLYAKSSEKPIADSQLAESSVMHFLNGYVERCQLGLGENAHLEACLDEDALKSLPFMARIYEKAKRRARNGEEFLTKSALGKLVEFNADGPVFRNLPDKFEPLNQSLTQELETQFSPFMDDAIHQIVARHSAGTGSVNMGRYYFLVGPKFSELNPRHGHYHVVEVKKQRQGAPLYFYPHLSPANRLGPAHLTVVCQRKMQRRPDLVLDDCIWQEHPWLVRSRHHCRLGLDPEKLAMGKRAVNKLGLLEYMTACGHALALAHCRGDRRSLEFEQSVVDTFTSQKFQILQAAKQYAKQCIADWQILRKLEQQG